MTEQITKQITELIPRKLPAGWLLVGCWLVAGLALLAAGCNQAHILSAILCISRGELHIKSMGSKIKGSVC